MSDYSAVDSERYRRQTNYIEDKRFPSLELKNSLTYSELSLELLTQFSSQFQPEVIRRSYLSVNAETIDR